MRHVRVDYTIYSPNYEPGKGECWDADTLRSAKRLAKRFGAGSLIVRNFNEMNRTNVLGDWWQASFCWVWNGRSFPKARSIEQKRWKATPVTLPDRQLALDLRDKLTRKG
jgi:hypothetical protein